MLACLVLLPVGHVSAVLADEKDKAIEEQSIDGEEFFRSLVQRYRKLVHYVENTLVEEVFEDQEADLPPLRSRTHVRVEIKDGRLEVERPGLLDDAIRTVAEHSEPASEADLWLLPHMSLRFLEDPLKDFRKGVDEGFVPSEASIVNVDNRQLVRLELCSSTSGMDLTEARFKLFIDPDRMLIERIEGEQQLPNGMAYSTSLEIDTLHVFEGESSQGTGAEKPEAEEHETRPVQTPAG